MSMTSDSRVKSTDSAYAEYKLGSKNREKYGVLVYSGDGFDRHAIRYLRNWKFTTHVDDMINYFIESGWWDGSHLETAELATLTTKPACTAPQNSNFNGQYAELVVENRLKSMGYKVVRGIIFGRDVFRREYKWDFVAFTDQVEIYVEVKSQDHRGSMQDKLVKTCHSIDSISTQFFD